MRLRRLLRLVPRRRRRGGFLCFGKVVLLVWIYPGRLLVIFFHCYILLLSLLLLAWCVQDTCIYGGGRNGAGWGGGRDDRPVAMVNSRTRTCKRDERRDGGVVIQLLIYKSSSAGLFALCVCWRMHKLSFIFVIFGISLVSEDVLAVCLERLGRRASSDFLPPNEEERKTSQDALPTTHPFIATGSQVHKSSKTVDDGEPFVKRQTKTYTTLYPPPPPPKLSDNPPRKVSGPPSFSISSSLSLLLSSRWEHHHHHPAAADWRRRRWELGSSTPGTEHGRLL